MSKLNKTNKFNTLKEVIEALGHIDRKAALYLWDNFDEDDFQHGAVDCIGALCKDSVGPLDFFFWHTHNDFNWSSLNKQLKQSDAVNKTNLDDYTTKDIDFTGCDPVIAKALKKNKSILCKVRDEGEFYVQQYNIVSYRKGKPYPYETTGNNAYKHAEPIKKRKTEFRVKDSVSIMQYLLIMIGISTI